MSIGFSLITIQNEMRIDNQSIFEQVKYSGIQYQLLCGYIWTYIFLFMPIEEIIFSIPKKKKGFFLLSQSNYLHDHYVTRRITACCFAR
jgi:hypothetical protein